MPDIYELADAAGNTSTSYTLGVGQTAQGTLVGTGDHDWYRVDLQAGQQYTFAMVGTGTNNVQDTYLRLYAPNGSTMVASNDDGLPDKNSIFTFTASTTGSYYLDAGAFLTGDTGQYGVSVTQGARASFDVQMGAGVMDTDLSWSTPGTAANVTYAFRASSGGQPNFSQLSSSEIATVQSILAMYSEVANLHFTQVNPGGYSDSATILLSNYSANDGRGAFGYFPGSTASASLAGDMYLNTTSVNTASQPLGGYSYFAIMHEMGHAMGLNHPGLYNASQGTNITYATDAEFIQDSNQYSVMSYFNESYTSGSNGGYADTLMLYDVYQLQQIYGANISTRAGNTVYGFGSNAGAAYDFSTNTNPELCIWDGGGSDTLNCSGFSQNQLINLNEGAFSNIGGLVGDVSIALGAVIENAVGGSGNDAIYGNSADNTLDGGAGNDWLQGGAGNDSIDGGDGTDTVQFSGSFSQYVIAPDVTGATDVVTIARNPGGVTDVLSHAEVLAFSDLTLTLGKAATTGQDLLNGLAAGDYLAGLAGNDTIYGQSGDDFIDGGDGNDIVAGNIGNDTVLGGAGDDTVNGGAGNDVVLGGTGNDLLAGVWGDDSIAGGTGDDTLAGMDGNDTLTGGDGNDSIDGAAGVDVAIFSDVYANYSLSEIDGGLTVVTHNGSVGDGTDTVANVEILRFIDGDYTAPIFGGAGNDSLTGTLSADIVAGLAGNDSIFAFDGNDTINGGDGNDLIAGNVGNDSILGGNGNDTLNGGAGADTVTGGTGNNLIAGVWGSDLLLGGAGNDTIDGGTGGGDSITGGLGGDAISVHDGATAANHIAYTALGEGNLGGAGIAAAADSITGFAHGRDSFDFASAAFVTHAMVSAVAIGAADVTIDGIDYISNATTTDLTNLGQVAAAIGGLAASAAGGEKAVFVVQDNAHANSGIYEYHDGNSDAVVDVTELALVAIVHTAVDNSDFHLV